MIKALNYWDPSVCEQAAAIILGARKDRKKNAPVEELISAITNTPSVIDLLIKIGNKIAIEPIANELLRMNYAERKKRYSDYIGKFGIKNKTLKSIAKILDFPVQFAETNNVFCGETVNSVIRNLSDSMDRIPALSEQQILLEYEAHVLSGVFFPRELLHGSTAEMKKIVKEQLTADKKWLSDRSSWKKTSFNIISWGWEALIQTNYIRGDFTNYFRTILWRASHNNKDIYYLTVSGDRNW